MFFSQKQIYGYEVKNGSLSKSNVYEAIALREETVVNSTYSGYINYFAKEGERTGAYKMVCTVDTHDELNEERRVKQWGFRWESPIAYRIHLTAKEMTDACVSTVAVKIVEK